MKNKLLAMLVCILLFGCKGGKENEITNPPNELIEVDLFIIYGQSNGSGSALEKSSGRGLLWWNHSLSAKPLRDPTRYDYQYCDCGSAWPSFGDAWFELTGRLPLIMNVAKGGANIDELINGSPYLVLEKWHSDLVEYGNFNIKTKAIIFVHGEADSYGLMDGSEYSDKVVELYEKIKINIAPMDMFLTHVPEIGGTSIEIGISQSEINWPGIHYSFSKSAAFNPLLLEGDGVHFNQTANELMGRELAKNIWMKREGANISALMRSELHRIK